VFLDVGRWKAENRMGDRSQLVPHVVELKRRAPAVPVPFRVIRVKKVSGISVSLRKPPATQGPRKKNEREDLLITDE